MRTIEPVFVKDNHVLLTYCKFSTHEIRIFHEETIEYELWLNQPKLFEILCDKNDFVRIHSGSVDKLTYHISSSSLITDFRHTIVLKISSNRKLIDFVFLLTTSAVITLRYFCNESSLIFALSFGNSLTT
jgi:hypothetical protein